MNMLYEARMRAAPAHASYIHNIESKLREKRRAANKLEKEARENEENSKKK